METIATTIESIENKKRVYIDERVIEIDDLFSKRMEIAVDPFELLADLQCHLPPNDCDEFAHRQGFSDEYVRLFRDTKGNVRACVSLFFTLTGEMAERVESLYQTQDMRRI
jgi:hypothetical protein